MNTSDEVKKLLACQSIDSQLPLKFDNGTVFGRAEGRCNKCSLLGIKK